MSGSGPGLCTWPCDVYARAWSIRLTAERPGKPEEIVAPLIMLSSRGGMYMNDALLTVDGGRLMVSASGWACFVYGRVLIIRLRGWTMVFVCRTITTLRDPSHALALPDGDEADMMHVWMHGHGRMHAWAMLAMR